MANYYADGFSYGTYINGVYCTGKTVAKVNEELSGLAEQMPIRLTIGEKTFTIMPESIDYRYDYEKPLYEFLNNQNPYLWGMNIGQAVNYEMEPSTTYDEEKVAEALEAFELERIYGPHNVKMYLTKEDGYVLRDNKDMIVDTGKVYDVLVSALDTSAFVDANIEGEVFHTLDIDAKSVLKDKEYTENEQKLMELYKLAEAFQNKKISFNFSNGDTKTLNKTEMANFVIRDNNGMPILNEHGVLKVDEECVRNHLESVLAPYNTYQNHYFNTHNGDVVHITKGTYGSKIDIESQVEPVLELLSGDGILYEADIDFIKEPAKQGGIDIGDTYLEISIDEQHLYYFENGKLKLDSDVVTGNHSHGSDTPKGVFDVFYKQRNRTLVGANYRSFVKYWINFAHHIGVHDASWRDEYGGDLYLYGGSHGCVNTPEENVAKLYDMIELGTPVIVY